MARIGVTGMGPHAFRARNAEALLQDGAGAAAAAGVVGEGEETNSDLYASRRIPAPPGARTRGRARDRGGADEGLREGRGDFPGSLPPRRPPTSSCRIPRCSAAACRAAKACRRQGEGEYAMRMKMVLAAISGQVRWEGADHRRAAAIAIPVSTWRARGKIGFMNGSGLITISPAASGSSVQYDGEVQGGRHHRVRGAADD